MAFAKHDGLIYVQTVEVQNMQAGDVFHIKSDDVWERILAAFRQSWRVDVANPHQQTYRFFDTFDWRLHNAGLSAQIVVKGTVHKALVVDCARNAIVAEQEGLRQFGFADASLNASMHRVLAGVMEMRKLMALASLETSTRQVVVRNEDEKIICRMSLEDCLLPSEAAQDGAQDKQLGLFVSISPVKGYEKDSQKLREILRDPSFETEQTAGSLHLIAFESAGLKPGGYSSKLSLSLSPQVSAIDAMRQIHLTLLDTMQQNEEGTYGNIDSEFLHDFRVAIRRTRSALTLIDKKVLPADRIKQAKEDFKWIGQQTNRMRDLDVYMLDYADLRSSVPGSFQDHLTPFKTYLEKESKKESRRIRALIRDGRYKTICADWRHYLQQGYATDTLPELANITVKQLADERIWKCYRKVMKEGGALTPESPAAALHAFRITVKKLRYLLEFFQSLYPAGELGKLIKSLKAFQNVLGDFQDTEVQSHAIVEMGREMAAAKAAPVETQMAMGMVADSILQKQDEARAAFHTRFDAFSQPQIHELFKQLFKDGA